MRQELKITSILLIMFILASSITIASASDDIDNATANDKSIMHIETEKIEQTRINQDPGTLEQAGNNQEPGTLEQTGNNQEHKTIEETENNHIETKTADQNILMGISKSDEDISAPNSNLSKLKDEIYGENLESNVEARISTNPIINVPLPSLPIMGDDPKVLYVDPDISWFEDFVRTTTFRNLKSALKAASPHTTILLKPGVYGDNSDSDLTIDKEVSIGRWGEYGEVIFEGYDAKKIFNIQKTLI